MVLISRVVIWHWMGYLLPGFFPRARFHETRRNDIKEFALGMVSGGTREEVLANEESLSLVFFFCFFIKRERA